VSRLLSFLLLFVSAMTVCVAKDNYHMSAGVGLEEVGINKVLCMKNGYTLLFHFENNKPIKIQVFDTAHQRVASNRHQCNILDVFMLTTTVFKGLHEVNGEAVLFFEQQNSGKHVLIRLRFDGVSGKLIDEKKIGKSQGLSKPMRFFVMRHKAEPGYAILYCQDAPQFRESKIHVAYFNAQHEQYKEIPLVFDRKKYDFLSVAGAESTPAGICISLGLSNMLVNGTGTTMGATPVYNHYLHVFYIPKDSSRPVQRTADLSTEVIPYYTNLSHNPFAGTINLMMLSYRDALYRYGIEMRPTAFLSNILFRFDEQNLSGGYNWLTNKLANAWMAEKTDTTDYFIGFPLKMVTNSNGLSTVFSESYNRYINVETYSRSQVFETYLGNICITQFDDEGKEIWGTVLPKSQYYKSYRHYYMPADLSKRWQSQAMFNDLPPQVYERQFVTTNIYNKGDDYFIIYNDGSKNFNNSLTDPGDTVFSSSLSNACYYKMSRKRDVTKHYLLGEPLIKEYKSSFVEGADFDEQRGVYASLIRYKRGDYVSLRMVWVRLE
jgi:hypothetical protein